MAKRRISSVNDLTELLSDWRSRNKQIVVAYFSNPNVTQAWFMVRTRSLKLSSGAVELGGPGGFAFFSLEGATVSPTERPMLHSTRKFFERIEPLVPEDSTLVEAALAGGSVVLLWDSPAASKSPAE